MGKDDDTGTEVMRRIAREEVTDCQRTSDVRNEGVQKSLEGVKDVTIEQGKQIAEMGKTLYWVAKTQKGLLWLVSAIAISCISIAGSQVRGCIQENGRLAPTVAIVAPETTNQ